MGLNSTTSGNRFTIGLFGPRNVGKSSLINVITRQDLVLTSDIPGTTTDPVGKAMELLPIGPIMIYDTAGIDDSGELGTKRVHKSYEILRKCDLALFVLDATRQNEQYSIMANEFIEYAKEKCLPVIIVINKCGEADSAYNLAKKFNIPNNLEIVCTNALDGMGIQKLKDTIIKTADSTAPDMGLVDGIVKPLDIVMLVTPIDAATPKGRLILPQQQVLRAILDMGAIAVVTKDTEIEAALTKLGSKPDIVITDSQAFKIVDKKIPKDVPLTSFSIIFARQKGNLEKQILGVKTLKELKSEDKVLISEGCTHHRQCNDIGSVQLPNMVKKLNPDIEFEWTSGGTFPEDLSEYKMIIHCGACMLNKREMQFRINEAVRQNVPIANYGMVIASCNGILERAIKPFGIEI